jgi:ribonucleoside-diphosphate reductase alpha chain
MMLINIWHHGAFRLDQDIRTLVERHGLRNGTLTTIAPTGTTSMFAGNVSSGIEPIFSTSFTRTIITPNGEKSSERVMDYAAWQFAIYGPNAPPCPIQTVTCHPMITSLCKRPQEWIDSGISKTVNCPEDIPFEAFKDIYRAAYDAGCGLHDLSGPMRSPDRVTL